MIPAFLNYSNFQSLSSGCESVLANGEYFSDIKQLRKGSCFKRLANYLLLDIPVL